MSETIQWRQDPDDDDWQVCGHPEIGLLRSDQNPALWAPAYLSDGLPAGPDTDYHWYGLVDAQHAAEREMALDYGPGDGVAQIAYDESDS